LKRQWEYCICYLLTCYLFSDRHHFWSCYPFEMAICICAKSEPNWAIHSEPIMVNLTKTTSMKPPATTISERVKVSGLLTAHMANKRPFQCHSDHKNTKKQKSDIQIPSYHLHMAMTSNSKAESEWVPKWNAEDLCWQIDKNRTTGDILGQLPAKT